ncbi:unnamed protein product [Mytilus edulis]|uniref:ZP-C domain-containing protein n=1 Tax=Mytilus edulis TaxID=6550 RepID=A0A8S3REB6_MYTED|nr:unnamed protein product [Mytilus edulis]
MSKRESGENNINNIHRNLEQQTISGVGHFVVQLKFFSDSNFQHEFNGFPPSYMVGQNVYVKATTPIHDYNVKMRLSDCYTKPSKSASDSYIYYLIQNGISSTPSILIQCMFIAMPRFVIPMTTHVTVSLVVVTGSESGKLNQEDEPIEDVGPIGYAEDEATVLFQKKQVG